jgi:hypothetical protein
MSVEEILAEIPKLSRHEAELVERALRDRGADKPSIHDLAGHLFDGADDMPADLWTNPKYMKTFGR